MERIAVAIAVIGAVLAEDSGSSAGLGHLLKQSNGQLETARAYAARLGVGPALEAALAAQPTGKEAQTGSPLMVDLHSDGMYAPGITYTNIVTIHDQVVLPYTSGLLPGPGVTNIVLQDGCPQNTADHLNIYADARALAFVVNALDPRRPVSVPCGTR